MRISSGALLFVILAAPACQQPDFEPQYLQAQTEPPPSPVADEERPAAAEPIAGPRALSADEGCDPNYRPCVPIASDVDCLGGGGNGPAYVRGPVRVIRRDIYQLDRDGDGVGCDR